MKRFDRRTLLRGTLAGGAVTVGLPLLDCFLNNNGTALAQGGALPLRFGAWFWGCGLNPGRWIPEIVGEGYDLKVELQAMDRDLPLGGKLRDQVTLLSGFDADLDGKPNLPHTSGLVATITGYAPDRDDEYVRPTLDSIIASAVGGETRFRSIETSCTGIPIFPYSFEANTIANAPEVSPVALYNRIFGPDFADPNDESFTPDPLLVLRQSVLSAVKEDRDRLMQVAGSHDRQRLDQYFTAVRQLETQIEVLLAGPPELASCTKAEAPTSEDIGLEVAQSISTNAVMAELLAFALACDQTRVFSQMFSYRISLLRRPGAATDHHQLTHDEAVDPELGYQPLATEFVFDSVNAWVDFIEKLAAIPEGDGTLLDNSIVFGHSEVSFAKEHSVKGIPMMIAGRGGGRLRPGLHVVGGGSQTTRVGLTIQQAMGLEVERWGTGAMEVDEPISELLA